MTEFAPVVFLLDVDNTLTDSPAAVKEPKASKSVVGLEFTNYGRCGHLAASRMNRPALTGARKCRKLLKYKALARVAELADRAGLRIQSRKGSGFKSPLSHFFTWQRFAFAACFVRQGYNGAPVTGSAS